MSKKNKRRKNGKSSKGNPKVDEDSAVQKSLLSRRRFLLASAIGLPPLLYFGSNLLTEDVEPRAEGSDQWSFLRRDKPIHDPPLPLEIVLGLVRMGNDRQGVLGDKEKQRLLESKRDAIFEEVTKSGFDPARQYELSPIVQYYGIPEKDEFTEGMIAYFEKALNFLHTKVTGLSPHKPVWTPIKIGDSYEQDFQGRGFIGQSYYAIRGIRIDNEMGQKTMISTGYQQHTGAFYNVHFKRDQLATWLMFLTPGTSALLQPFSEVIPITTAQASKVYLKKVGVLQAIVAEETISEAMSYLLTKEIIKELSIPNGLEYSRQGQKEMLESHEKYRFVPKAIRWIESHGMQQAFDLYMDSPEKFMYTIMKST